MTTRTRMIFGDETEVLVYGDKTRFLIVASFAGLPEDAREKAATRGYSYEEHKDGSVSVGTQRLISWDTGDDELDELHEQILCEIEVNLEAEYGALTSSLWNIGHRGVEYDGTMSATDRAIVQAEEAQG